MTRPARRSPIVRLVRFFFRCAVLLTVAVIIGNVWLELRCRDRVYVKAEDVPFHTVGLVLGTGKQKADGSPNGHFTIRMDAAAALWKAGSVKVLLLSGDNGSDPRNYNEPADMRDALRERGVPDGALVMDLAGLRTLDSIVRAVKVFGVHNCLIISDDFHLPRALWLADRNGLKAVGFAGHSLGWDVSWKGRTREWLARVNALIETGVLRKSPDYGDEKHPLPR